MGRYQNGNKSNATYGADAYWNALMTGANIGAITANIFTQAALKTAAQISTIFTKAGYATAEKLSKVYVSKFQESLTSEYIARWVRDIDSKRPHIPNEETSPGGRYYTYIKNELERRLKRLPGPLESAVRRFLMDSPAIQQILRSDQMAAQFESVDPIIRQIYETEYPLQAKTMRWHGLLYDQKYNHKFLTETSDGKIVEITQDQIAAFFKKSHKHGTKGEEFPHVIVTSSHAQGETLADVRSIVHGIEALAYHSGDGKTPLQMKHIDQGVKPGDTIIVYACDVHETPWKNGAALLRRVNEIKRLGDNPDTEFRYASPGSIRIQKLMLKCKSEGDQSKLIDAQDMRPIEQSLAHLNKPITLRPDAGIISHHFQLIGYSKGGEVISTAGRYGVHALAMPNGTHPLFRMHAANEACKKTGDFTMSDANIRHIMRGHAHLALASVEAKLCSSDKARGLHRLAINNYEDLISTHHNYGNEDPVRDRRLIVNGTSAEHGHAPSAFFGKRSTKEDAAINDEFYHRGYVLDDPEAARYFFQYFAPNYHKAAIGHLSFNGKAHEGELTLEAAPGTLDAKVMEHKDIIEKMLTIKLRKAVTLEARPEEPGLIALRCRGVDWTRNVEMLNRLKLGFEELRKPSVEGLVIAQAILDEEIPTQIKKAEMLDKIGIGPQANGNYKAA